MEVRVQQKGMKPLMHMMKLSIPLLNIGRDCGWNNLSLLVHQKKIKEGETLNILNKTKV